MAALRPPEAMTLRSPTREDAGPTTFHDAYDGYTTDKGWNIKFTGFIICSELLLFNCILVQSTFEAADDERRHYCKYGNRVGYP